jgi:hypothetical protein
MKVRTARSNVSDLGTLISDLNQFFFPPQTGAVKNEKFWVQKTISFIAVKD